MNGSVMWTGTHLLFPEGKTIISVLFFFIRGRTIALRRLATSKVADLPSLFWVAVLPIWILIMMGIWI